MTPEKEKELMQDALNHPGTKLLMKKLNEAAEKASKKYDTASSHEDFLKLQMLRSVLLVEVPRIIERIVNHKEREKWSFFEWLRRVVS